MNYEILCRKDDYPLIGIVNSLSSAMGISLSPQNPPVDIYDNFERMPFNLKSLFFRQAITFIGPMVDDLTLVGNDSKEGLIHCYSGCAVQTGLLYAQTDQRVVLVSQGHPAGRVAVEMFDRNGSKEVQRLAFPYIDQGEVVIADDKDKAAPDYAIEGLEKVLTQLLVR